MFMAENEAQFFILISTHSYFHSEILVQDFFSQNFRFEMNSFPTTQRTSRKYPFLFHPFCKTSREVANLTERKNPHTPAYGVKEFVCLSVCDKL